MEVELRAIHPFSEEQPFTYSWRVSNAKLISGQGSSHIAVKAGRQKTPGYINASGFIDVEVTAEAMLGGTQCTINAAIQLMIGQHVEANYAANVESLELSESILKMPCGDRSLVSPVVAVRSKASDPDFDVMFFSYRVTAGRVVGGGSQVNWDLTGAPPGSHSISLGVDDGFGVRAKTKTVKLTLVACDNVL